uniref:Ovule protein n=1 Tax=Strongyloides papillosus TaxID=174720 RepID=A0A0N5BBV4_STREA
MKLPFDIFLFIAKEQYAKSWTLFPLFKTICFEIRTCVYHLIPFTHTFRVIQLMTCDSLLTISSPDEEVEEYFFNRSVTCMDQ